MTTKQSRCGCGSRAKRIGHGKNCPTWFPGTEGTHYAGEPIRTEQEPICGGHLFNGERGTVTVTIPGCGCKTNIEHRGPIQIQTDQEANEACPVCGASGENPCVGPEPCDRTEANNRG